MAESLTAKKVRAGKILADLKLLYPNAKCSLDHASPLQLLVATILSAQCTDVRVNMVTPKLFAAYPDARALAAASQEDIEKLIQSTGFFRSKAKALRQTAQSLVELHGGEVPQTMAELTAFAGVGRKTANVVLGNAFGQNVGIVVDTHVGRLSLRLGLTKQTNAVKVEQDLVKLIPQSDWTVFSHLLIYHGRAVCLARSPRCSQCTLLAHCPTGQRNVVGHS